MVPVLVTVVALIPRPPTPVSLIRPSFVTVAVVSIVSPWAPFELMTPKARLSIARVELLPSWPDPEIVLLRLTSLSPATEAWMRLPV